MSLDRADTAESAIGALTKLNIEPPDGWQPERAVTLDDFSVLVSQALKLDVDSAAEPRVSYQALREQGLPVEQMFPGYSAVGEAPLLLESEVRRFLAVGLAEGNMLPGH